MSAEYEYQAQFWWEEDRPGGPGWHPFTTHVRPTLFWAQKDLEEMTVDIVDVPTRVAKRRIMPWEDLGGDA